MGYLTKNLQDTLREFTRLGFRVEQDVSFDPLRKLGIAFLKNGAYRVELIEPEGEASPLFPLLKKYKNTPYHLCYETDRLAEEIRRMEQGGYRVIQEPLDAPCIQGGTVAFLIHADMGIVELLKREERP